MCAVLLLLPNSWKQFFKIKLRFLSVIMQRTYTTEQQKQSSSVPLLPEQKYYSCQSVALHHPSCNAFSWPRRINGMWLKTSKCKESIMHSDRREKGNNEEKTKYITERLRQQKG